MCSCAPELTVKQKVGLEMLSEAREGEFSAAFGILVKVLGNIVATPEEPKYRKLRTSNDKIKSLLATKGVRRARSNRAPFPAPPPLLGPDALPTSCPLAGTLPCVDFPMAGRGSHAHELTDAPSP